MSEQPLFRKAALERLSSPEQLDQLLRGTSLRSWILLLALLGLMAVLVAWGFLGQVNTEIQAQGSLVLRGATGKNLHAAVYMTAHDASRIERGMNALVLPVGANAQESGYLQGRVTNVADQPAPVAELLSAHIPESRVRELTKVGAAYAVDIALTPAADAPSGYQWTSGFGPQGKLKIGTAVSASIIVERRRPVELAIPTLERILPDRSPQ